MAETNERTPLRDGAVRARSGQVQLSPITDPDLPQVAHFLGAHMPPDMTVDGWPDAWRRSANLAGRVEAPNHGFLLRHHDRLVGVYLAIYSDRTVGGRPERFCNLAVWYVLPDYRLHSLRMVKAILAQKGWHFTDFTPIPDVQRLNTRLGFRFLDTTTAVVPNLPWPSWPGRTVVSSDPALIEATLTGQDRLYFRDHAATSWARHLVLISDDQWCYVIFRKERRKNLPLFANILYASNPTLLRRAFRPLARHLLLRHGALATLVELRVAGHRPGPSFLLANHCPKMFKSASLEPADIDYLYSELTSAP